MSRLSLITLFMLVVLPSSVRGEFVLDDFSSGDFTATLTAGNGSISVTRVITDTFGTPPGQFEYFALHRGFRGTDMFEATFEYTVSNSGTFGDVNEALDPGSTVDGFQVGLYAEYLINPPPFEYFVEVKLDGVQAIKQKVSGNSFQFSDPDFAASKRLELIVGNNLVWEGHLYLGGGGAGGGGDMIATPEPTSLVLFSCVALGGIFMRRFGKAQSSSTAFARI